MITGLGTDIIEIARIRAILKRWGPHFYEKLFHKEESAYCLSKKDAAPSFAGHFCAKEAVAKALGTGFGRHLSFLDIICLHDDKGAPYITLSKQLKDIFSSPQFLLSISHCTLYAQAVAIRINN